MIRLRSDFSSLAPVERPHTERLPAAGEIRAGGECGGNLKSPPVRFGCGILTD